MKKIPGGLFLIPMFMTAIIDTFWPTLFQIGGATQAVFSARGINYAIGVLLFCSGTGLKLSHLPSVLKKEGILVFAKLILSFLFGFLFSHLLGMEGSWGIITIAFIAVIMMPFLRIALGANITIIKATQSGLQGILLIIVFYLLTWLPLLFIERKLLHFNGLAARASISLPYTQSSLFRCICLL